MTEKNFSIELALKYGWKKMTENLGFFIILLISLFAISFFFNVFSGMFQNRLPSLSLIFTIGGVLFSVYMNIILIRVGLNIFDGERGRVEDILSGALPIYFKFLLANVLYFLIVLAGFLLLIVPGIYFALKYQYTLYLIVDKGMDVVPAFNMSSEITKGVKWRLLLFAIAVILIGCFSMVIFFVGFLIAYPVIIMSVVYVYRSLYSQTSIDDDEGGQSSSDPFSTPSLPG